MSFAIALVRIVLFVSSILFGLAGLEAGPYTSWIDACLFNSILLNITLLLDLCADGGEESEVVQEAYGGIHLATFGIFVLVMILTLHAYGA